MLRSLGLGNLPNDHQQIATLEDSRGRATRILREEFLTAQQDTVEVDVPDAPPALVPTAAASPPRAGHKSSSVLWVLLAVAAVGAVWFVRRVCALKV